MEHSPRSILWLGVLVLMSGLTWFMVERVAYWQDPCVFRGDEQPPMGPGGVEECRVSENTYQYESNHRTVAEQAVRLAIVFTLLIVACWLLFRGVGTMRAQPTLWGTAVGLLVVVVLVSYSSWGARIAALALLGMLVFAIKHVRPFRDHTLDAG